MKYTFPLALFTLLLSLARPCLAQLPTWQSAQIVHSTPGAGGIGDSHTQANAISPTGDTYYYYTSDAGIEIGGQTYTSNGGGHVVAHYDPAGNFSGVLVSGGPVLDIQTDEAGNVYVAGQIYPNVYLRIGNTPPIRALGRARGDFFLAKWNAAGTLQWIRHDAAQLLSTHIGIDTLGHVTLGGYFINMAVVNGDTLTTPASNPRLLVMQYDAAGSFRWAQSSTGQSVNHVSLAAAPNGTLFLAASVGNGPFTWGAATIPTGPPPGHTSCWLKLSSSGQLLAYRRFGYEPDHPKVASDKSGNCYLLAHQEQSPFALGNTSFPLPAAASQKALVLNLGPNGNPLWLQPVYLTGPGGHVAGADLCVTPVPAANARVYVGGSFGPQNDTLRCGALSLASPGSPVRGFLLSLDAPSGAPAWLISLRSDATNFFTAFTHVSANARGEVSVGARSAGDTTYFGTIALTRLPTVANPSVALSAKLLENYNQLQGTVFSDVNLNGLRDANEPGYPGVAVESNPGQYHFVSSHDGRYFAFLGLGTHTLSVPRPPRHHNVVPIGPATHTFSTYGNLTAGPDFAIQAIPNQQDLRIFLTPLRRARPGFQVPYRVTYHNIGTVAIPTGLVTMVPDTLLTYLSSSPPATQSGTTLTWPFTSLQPGETRQIDVLFHLPPSARRGDTLHCSAMVEPLAGDLVPADNYATSGLVITAAFDPNDISVNYEALTLPQVQAGSHPLDYTIRFQNMGTDTAFTVVIRDTLPADLLDLSSLELLAASHSASWHLSAGNVLTITFPNALLPDTATNRAASNGFARFRLLPRPTLPVGTQIPNRAHIYFDFNPPVATNTALTTVTSPLGLPRAFRSADLRAWPNPASTTLCVELDAAAGPLTSLTLLDALGRPVRHALPAARSETLDLNGLSPGVYILRAQTRSRTLRQAVVIAP